MPSRWMSRLGLGGALAGLAVFSSAGLAAGSAAAAPPPPRLLLPAKSPIVNPAVLAQSQPLHSVNPNQAWTFGLVLPSQNPTGLEAYASAVSTPGSPDYHHFLTNAQMLARFGPPANVLTEIDAYLAQHGLKGQVLGQILHVTGTVAQVDRLFSATLTQYQHGSTQFIAPNGDISIPGALRVAAGIDGLSTANVKPLSKPLTNLASRVIVPTAVTAMHPTPPGTVATGSNGPMTVTAELLDGSQTPGMAVHYLITTTMNGQPDPNAVFDGLQGPLRGAGGFIDTSVTNAAGQFVMDFTLSQTQSTSLLLTVVDAATGATAEVQLPAATFQGPSINVCTNLDPVIGVKPGTKIICPWNPSSNSVNTTFNANGLVNQSRRAGPTNLAVFAATNDIAQSVSDAAQFAGTFGLPPANVSLAYTGAGICTPATCPGVQFDIQVELSLDLQMMETSSPGANIQVYASGSLRDALNQVVYQDTARVFSISYGEGELAEQYYSPGAQQTWDLLAWEANVEGITISVAAGDNGAYSGALEPGTPGYTNPQPSYPANSGGVSALGGLEAAVSPSGQATELAMWGGNLGAELPHEVLLSFLEQQNMMASGGFSTLEPKPLYQYGFSPPGVGRGTPDFSLPASVVTPGYFFFMFGIPNLVGGTSASAPLFAGYMGDVGNVVGSPLGNVNYAIYPLSRFDRGTTMPVAFGNNGAYSVTPGYNAVTGLGGLNIDRLAADLEGVYGAFEPPHPHRHGHH